MTCIHWFSASSRGPPYWTPSIEHVKQWPSSGWYEDGLCLSLGVLGWFCQCSKRITRQDYVTEGAQKRDNVTREGSSRALVRRLIVELERYRALRSEQLLRWYSFLSVIFRVVYTVTRWWSLLCYRTSVTVLPSSVLVAEWYQKWLVFTMLV